MIGGGNPIAVQSMTNTRTEDVDATVEQILRLEKAGCELIRSTVPTMEAAAAFSVLVLVMDWTVIGFPPPITRVPICISFV